MASVLTAAERRKRLRLKRIVVSEHNYLALKRLGQAGDSFNDVVSRLLQVYRAYQEKKQKEEQQQQENADEKYITSNDRLHFPDSISELFSEYDRHQLADLLGYREKDSSRKSKAIVLLICLGLPQIDMLPFDVSACPAVCY
jgi:predicted CopG family antitoxin